MAKMGCVLASDVRAWQTDISVKGIANIHIHHFKTIFNYVNLKIISWVLPNC